MSQADALQLLHKIAELATESPSGRITTRRAAQYLGADRPTATKLQVELIEDGLLELLPDQPGARLATSKIDVPVRLTANGHAVIDRQSPHEPSPETWSWREIPVIRAAVAGIEAMPIVGIQFDEIASHTGLSTEDVFRSARALETAGLVSLQLVMGPQGRNRINDVAGKARQLAGQWPSEETAFDRMIAALEAIAANTNDEDTRNRARKILDGFAGAGKTIGIGVATAVITGQVPGQ